MINVLAKIISYIFHPVLFVILMPYLLIYRQTTNISYALKWEIFSLAFIFFGILLVVLGKTRGVFSDFDLSKREERWKFYLLVFTPIFVYFIISLFIKGIIFSATIISMGIIVAVILFAIANKFLKPSIHTGVACAYVISMAILYGHIAFFVTFWTIPVIIWARLTLKKHTINEVLIGGIIGTVITLFTFWAGYYLYHL